MTDPDPDVVDDDNIDEMPWIFTSTARKLMFVVLALVVAVQALIVSPAVLLSFSPTLLLLVKHRQHRQDDADPADRGEPQTLRWGLPAVVGMTAAAASAAWRWPPADDYDRWFDTLLWLQAFTCMWIVASMVSLWRAPRSGWLGTHAIKVLTAQVVLLMGSTLIGVVGAGRVAAGSSQTGGDRLDSRLWFRCALRVRFRWRRLVCAAWSKGSAAPAAKLVLSTSPAQPSTVLMFQRPGRCWRLRPLTPPRTSTRSPRPALR